MKRTFVLAHQEARKRAIEAIQAAPEGYRVTVQENTRSLSQNDRFWATMEDIAKQVTWHGQKLTKEEWRTVFSAALLNQKVVPGIEGGFVVLGASTRQMTKTEMMDLIALAEAFGAERGVKFGGSDE